MHGIGCGSHNTDVQIRTPNSVLKRQKVGSYVLLRQYITVQSPSTERNAAVVVKTNVGGVACSL